MQDFANRYGLNFKFVVLPGGNAASIKQLTEGAVHFAFLAAHNLVASGMSGEIRVLGVAHGSRLPFLPSTPTFREQGLSIWLQRFGWVYSHQPVYPPIDLPDFGSWRRPQRGIKKQSAQLRNCRSCQPFWTMRRSKRKSPLTPIST